MNEINYNSSPLFNTGDWLEFYNPLNSAVTMSGWYFKDEDETHTYTFPDGFLLESDHYVIVCENVSLFTSLYPDISDILGNFEFGLSGSGEIIRLYNSQGILVDSLTFDDNVPWPKEADGYGPTLSLINPKLDNSVSHNWTSSKGNGTPGKRNDVYKSVDDAFPYFKKPYLLGQNFPNPFNQTTVIPLTILEACHVTVGIYMINGQKLGTLFSGAMEKGYHAIRFNASDVSSGIYFYRCAAGRFVQTKSLIIMK